MLTSCDDTESPVFNGDKTLVYFAQSSVALDVVIDETGTVEVPVIHYHLQDQDVNVNVELVKTKLQLQMKITVLKIQL